MARVAPIPPGNPGLAPAWANYPPFLIAYPFVTSGQQQSAPQQATQKETSKDKEKDGDDKDKDKKEEMQKILQRG